MAGREPVPDRADRHAGMVPAPMEPTEAVLAAAGAQALAAGRRFLDHVAVRRACAALTDDEWFSALVALRERRLVQMRDYDARVAMLSITPAGVQAAAALLRPDLEAVRARLLDLLPATDPHAVYDLGARLDESPLLVEALLDQLVAEKRVVFSRVGTDAFRIHRF